MNIVGKILAFLNLVFALVVGGLLAINYTTSTNWKSAYESKVRDVGAMQSQIKIWKETAILEQEKNKSYKGKVKDEFEGIVVNRDKYTLDMIKLQEQLDEQRNLRVQKEVALVEAEKTLKRRTEEVEFNRDLLEKRAKELLTRLAEIDVLKNDKVAALTQLQTMIDRAATALQDNKALRQEIFDLRTKTTEGDPRVVRKGENFPTVRVNGKVTGTRNALVSINVGLDEGVKKGHTLEVFRMVPQLEYVGILRIEDAEAHVSVGRLEVLGGANKMVRVGDIVANSLELGR